MKSVIKQILHSLGYEITKYKNPIQLRSKISKQLTFHKTATGNYFLPTDACADNVANEIISNKIFEKEVIELAKKYIQLGTSVLDVGANYGQMSVLFSNLVGDTGTVHAFEADDWIYEILQKNIEANNKTGKIIPHFGAVHNVHGDTLIFPVQDFKQFGAYGSYGIDYNAKQGREVKSITIDELNIEEKISFMKVDIQGGDLQAMQGARKTIEKNKMPIIFEYEYHFEERFNMCFQDYIDFVQSINYRFHKVVNGHNFIVIPS